MASRIMEPPAVDTTGKDSISAYGKARSTVPGRRSPPRNCAEPTLTGGPAIT